MKSAPKVAISTPMAGMFRHPVGAWVHPERFKSGAVWYRPLRAMTRRGVLGLAAPDPV